MTFTDMICNSYFMRRFNYFTLQYYGEGSLIDASGFKRNQSIYNYSLPK